MRWRTLLVLALLVGGLTWLHFARRAERAETATVPVQRPVLVGLEPREVTAVRIDHLARAVQIKLERDAAGSWFMTDPLAYPAVDSLVRQLLQMLARSLGEPAGPVAPADVGLDPPRVVLELVQVGADGPRTHRIEIGEVDLDSARVYVRLPGHPASPPGEEALILRAPRTIQTTFERNPDDYRDRRITHLSGREVTSIRRRGRAYAPALGHEVDLHLDALLGPDGWRRVDPPVVTLDPRAMALVARGAAELTAEYFSDDAPESMARWGLDPARVTLELTDERGDVTVLHLGYPEVEGPAVPGVERTWFCRREGFDHVFEISDRAVGLLTQPAEVLYDFLLFRARREDVREIELQAHGRRLVLSRDGETWSVAEHDGGGGEPRAYPADGGAVDGMLGTLEQNFLGDYLEDVPFQPEDPPMSIRIRTAPAGEWGGRFGEPWRDPESRGRGRQYLRYGDELTGWAGDEIVGLLELGLDELRSRELHRIPVGDVQAIRITHGGKGGGDELVYELSGDTKWIFRKSRVGAPEPFVVSVDRLLLLTAERWLEETPDDGGQGAEGGEPGEAVHVLVERRHGEDASFTLARGPGGETLFEQGGLRAVVDGRVAEDESELLQNLLSLFAD